MDAKRYNEALKLMMQRHDKAIYRYIRSQLYEHHISDELMVLVFIQAHRDFDRFARRSTLRAWLFAIAHNRVRDARKSQKLNQTKHTSLEGIDAPDGARTADELVDDANLAKALMECVQKLAAKVRDAVLLRYQGHSFEEIAEILGERAGTLQARVTRALPVLKDCIEGSTGKRV